MPQKGTKSLLMVSCALCAFLWQGAVAQQSEIPREWIDQDTGHRVVRLSDEPGSQSLYFHQNAYTPDGQKLIITTPTGLSAIDLKTRAIEKIVEGSCRRHHRRQKNRSGLLHADCDYE